MSAASGAAGRRTRTPSTNIERDLVCAAETVLVREGPAAVTVRAVAAEAGIAPMGVYNRLGGKSGLVDALLIRGFDLLYAAITGAEGADPLQRLRASGVRYRDFALANRHFYAVMFEGAIPHEHDSPIVAEHAAAAFGALVRHVETAAAGGYITAPDPQETAMQIWSTVHGAVALELQGLVLTPDAEVTYLGLLDLLLHGLAPA
ncbi:MAG: TetR-like C-terminal domain-containing protein [Actinomycetota bacterium]